ncbi:MAG: type VII secretion protein EssC, partial [Lachnospiraceae bacterium]|nr:type VII secretion protein EssC [Lachnospiraceae bacterium]
RMGDISIGATQENTISYSFMGLISGVHAFLRHSHDGWTLVDNSKNGIFIGNQRMRGSRKLQFGDRIDMFGLHLIFMDPFLLVGSNCGWLQVDESRLVPMEIREPEPVRSEMQDLTDSSRAESWFNRSPRNLPSLYTDPIEIEAPPSPRQQKQRPAYMVIGPAFTMAIPMSLGCLMSVIGSQISGRNAGVFMYTGLITAVGAAVIGAIWAVLNMNYTKKELAEDEEQRFNAYSNYLVEIADKVQAQYRHNTSAMNTIYPSAQQCVQYGRREPRLWNRNFTHADFLYTRLGLGDSPFQVEINVPKEKFSLINDTLQKKPQVIRDEFHMLHQVPVGVDLMQHGLIGIVGGAGKRGALQMMHTIVAGITASHCYTDVKLVFIYDEEDYASLEDWECMRWFPHVWSEDKSTRYMAANEIEIRDIFFELSNILRTRVENSSGSGNIRKGGIAKPHYVIFVSDPSILEGEILTKYIYDAQPLYGLTTFLMVETVEQLPNACETVIENDQFFQGIYNLMDMQEEKRNSFVPDVVSREDMENFGKRLANIHVREIESNSEIPSGISFFEMYGVNTLQEFNVLDRWRKNRNYNSMKALVGRKAGGADCYLDIHEKFHGPHGLVAGTTGSGKSETLQTYILSLAVNFSPEDVSFFIIDFKGGDMANLFSGLPHLAGQISNLSGNQVRRAMISIKSENMRRQRIFAENGVNNINLYTRLYKSHEASIPVPHLFIIIDEFAELKREEPEFMQELISVAQVGRSLGVHLILATQKPSGTVDDNIWSNSKFRLCLRVQDRQDSMDMLHKPDVAFLMQAGRCFLQVGNDEIFELFQSGFSGAVYTEGEGKSSAAASMIGRTGKADLVGARKKRIPAAAGSDERKLSDAALVPGGALSAGAVEGGVVSAAAQAPAKKSAVKETTQLDAVIDYLADLVKRAGYKKSDQLWLPVLPEALYLRSLIEMEEGTVPGSADLYFDGKSWAASAGEVLPDSTRRHPGKWRLETIIGLYDDPEQQAQRPFHIDFTDGGHLAVCGQVVSGKSTFLQTLIYGLINRYTPQALQLYLLDFSSNMLGCFADAPHVGGIVTDVQEDRQEKFFHMLSTLMDERRSALQGGNFAQYVQAYGMQLPAVLVVIDNYAGFRTKTNDKYDDVLLRLSREGVGYGIFLVVSAAGFGINDIPSRIGDNLRTIVSLEQPDKFKYMEIIRRTHLQIIPETNVKGRGLALVDDRPLEFQTALCMEAEDDFSRGQKIAAECAQMREAWKGEPARRIPEIPENPTLGILETDYRYRHALEERTLLPFGYFAQDASIASVDLLHNYCFMITGRARSGKTNLLRLLLHASAKRDADRVIIEKKTSEFTDFEKQASVYDARYVSDGKEMYKYFSELLPEFARRNKIKRALIESGMDEADIAAKMMEEKPIFIFIADMNDFMTMVYKKEAGIGDVSGFLENIMEKGSMHNIFFFACLRIEDDMGLRGYRAYNHYCSYKKGIHLGGNLQGQKIFNFQNIPFNQASKTLKKGFGHMSSDEEEGIGIDVVIPLAKI